MNLQFCNFSLGNFKFMRRLYNLIQKAGAMKQLEEVLKQLDELGAGAR